MAKKKPRPPVNFVDLRQVKNGGMIHDVSRPRPTRSIRLTNRHFLLLGLILIAIVLAAAIGFLQKPGIPAEINRDTSFTIYYPHTVPQGYHYLAGSSSVENGILLMTFEDKNQSVHISEQTVPAIPPDLNHLQGFKSFDSQHGSGAIGSAAGGSTAIIVIDSTLITVNASTKDQSVAKGFIDSLEAVE